MVPGLDLSASQKGQQKHGFSIHVYQLEPEVEGEIIINSNNPYDKPL